MTIGAFSSLMEGSLVSKDGETMSYSGIQTEQATYTFRTVASSFKLSGKAEAPWSFLSRNAESNALKNAKHKYSRQSY